MAKHNVVNIGSMEALKELSNRLDVVIESVRDEVADQIQLFGEALAAIQVAHTGENPMLVVFHKEVSKFGSDCLLLGYYLAKKPHELEAQLNEMRATYGSKEIDIEDA